MELSPTFNEAAQGAGQQTAADTGQIAPLDASPTVAAAHTYEAADGPPTIAPAFADAGEPVAPIPAAPPQEESEDHDRTSALEMLETERARPYLKNNLRPDRRVEQSTHADIEEQRELFIAWLRAEPTLEAPDIGPDHDLDDDENTILDDPTP